MTKKDVKKEEPFDLEKEWTNWFEADWAFRAFCKVTDTSKIKSKSDMDKAFKAYVKGSIQ